MSIAMVCSVSWVSVYSYNMDGMRDDDSTDGKELCSWLMTDITE